MITDRGLLSGIRVIDLTHILAGPYCTMLLADAGAEVIKVSPPGGEFSQVHGGKRRDATGRTVSHFSAAMNRGKRSVELDLKNPAGLAVLERLIATADVVVDNFAPSSLGRMGISYEELRRRHPRLVTASINLWGVDASDPLAKRGGVAIVAEGESSVLMGRPRSDGTPAHFGFPLGDVASGLAAYAAIVSHLFRRSRTGRGGHASISMVHTLLAMSATNVTAAQIPYLPGTGTAAYGVFPTRDGHVVLGVNSDRLWARLCECMDRADLASDPRFERYTERDQRVEEANALVSAWTAAHTTAEVVDRVAPSGVPVGTVMSPEAIVTSPLIDGLGYLWDIDDGIGGTVRVPANPLGFDLGSRRISPVGEDTDAVLGDVLGAARGEVGALREQGAFGSDVA
jgi:crotonobetainyl-CoA:carnitine CoA-transferase CaiB-like acyl-CoA transferase